MKKNCLLLGCILILLNNQALAFEWFSDCSLTGCCCCDGTLSVCYDNSGEEPTVDYNFFETCTTPTGNKCGQSTGDSDTLCESTCTVLNQTLYTLTASAGVKIKAVEFGLSGSWEELKCESANCVTGVSIGPRQCCYSKTWRRYEKTTISRTEYCAGTGCDECDYTTSLMELKGCTPEDYGLDCTLESSTYTCPSNPIGTNPSGY